MKTIKLRLTLNVEIDPQGETIDHLTRQLNRVASNAVNQGLLTGDTAATVEKYDYNVMEVKNNPIVPKKRYSLRKTGEHLFSTETECCITCGQNATDDLVENIKCTFKRKK